MGYVEASERPRNRTPHHRQLTSNADVDHRLHIFLRALGKARPRARNSSRGSRERELGFHLSPLSTLIPQFTSSTPLLLLQPRPATSPPPHNSKHHGRPQARRVVRREPDPRLGAARRQRSANRVFPSPPETHIPTLTANPRNPAPSSPQVPMTSRSASAARVSAAQTCTTTATTAMATSWCKSRCLWATSLQALSSASAPMSRVSASATRSRWKSACRASSVIGVRRGDTISARA
jgi:hypothetical protein